MESKELKWGAIIRAVLFMFILPILATFIIPTIVGVYIGFSTRGDMTQVNAAVQSLTTSVPFIVTIYAIFAVVALWRGYVLAKTVGDQFLLHFVIAFAATVLFVIGYFFLGSGGNLAVVVKDIAVIALMIAGGAFLGSLLKPARTAAA